MTLVNAESDFAGFYHTHFSDTVGLIYGFTGDLAEAQDLAQEAFCRAWRNWANISTYDEPGAWVKRVGVNLARSRWRRLRTAAAHMFHQRAEVGTEPPLSPDHVAVVAALRKLPKPQREAIVLHYIADMPVEDVARQLDAPVGTVKSWLHRARAAMAVELAIDFGAGIAVVPAEQFVKQAKRHQRVRTAAAGSSAALILVVVLLVVFLFQPFKRPQDPIAPTPSPSPVSTLDPDDPILAVDWASATIAFDRVPDGCPTGEVTFPSSRAVLTPLTFGDLTGDGSAEALLRVWCRAQVQGDLLEPELVLIRRESDGSLHAIGIMRDTSLSPPWISNGRMNLEPRPAALPELSQPAGAVDLYRWIDGTFVLEGASTQYPPIEEFDLRLIAGQLSCIGGQWLNSTGNAPKYVELGRFSRPYLLLRVFCDVAGTAIVLLDLVNGKWVGVAVIVPQPGTALATELVDGGTVKFSVTDKAGLKTGEVWYSWSGSAFVRVD